MVKIKWTQQINYLARLYPDKKCASGHLARLAYRPPLFHFQTSVSSQLALLQTLFDSEFSAQKKRALRAPFAG